MTPIETLQADFGDLMRRQPDDGEWMNGPCLCVSAQAWLFEAVALMEGVFPNSHATVRAIREAVEYVTTHTLHGPQHRTFSQHLAAARGAFRTAKQLVDSDRVRGFADIVRAKTEGDLLSQADGLLDESAMTAAAVMAGGALETHLRMLIDRHGIVVTGNPGLGSYNSAIATYRKKHPHAVYPKATGDNVSGWTKIRNKAAHEPLDFHDEYGAAHVRDMIGGIRSLISDCP